MFYEKDNKTRATTSVQNPPAILSPLPGLPQDSIVYKNKQGVIREQYEQLFLKDNLHILTYHLKQISK